MKNLQEELHKEDSTGDDNEDASESFPESSKPIEKSSYCFICLHQVHNGLALGKPINFFF